MERDETQENGGPRGEAIGSKVDLPPGPLEPALRETLRCIDRIHGATGLPPLAVVWMWEDSPRGRYRPATDGQRARIEISERGTTPGLTFVHEIGHCLDHFMGNFVRYASAAAISPAAQVIAVARRSEAHAQLRRESEDAGKPAFIRRNIIAYLMSDEELWARTYSQYIALRSENLEMAAEMARLGRQSDHERFTLWADQDFEPISEAMDSCLQSMGWRR